MKLGLGDVAVGLELDSGDAESSSPLDKLRNMYLVFGNDSSDPFGKSRSKDRGPLFHLGRLTSGQDYLDEWDRNPYGRTILYDVYYKKKTLR